MIAVVLRIINEREYKLLITKVSNNINKSDLPIHHHGGDEDIG